MYLYLTIYYDVILLQKIHIIILIYLPDHTSPSELKREEWNIHQ